jgi:hypothetical protein
VESIVDEEQAGIDQIRIVTLLRGTDRENEPLIQIKSKQPIYIRAHE